MDLVNGELEELELSEADKRVNTQLLEEARKSSLRQRGRRRRGSGGKINLSLSHITLGSYCSMQHVLAPL